MALTPEQVTEYYATEGKKARPLSPLAWQAQQQGRTDIAQRTSATTQKISQNLFTQPNQIVDNTAAPILPSPATNVTNFVAPAQASFQQISDQISQTYEKRLADAQKQSQQAAEKSQGLLAKAEQFLTQRAETQAPDTQQLFQDTLGQFGFTQESFQQQQSLIDQMAGFNAQIAQVDAVAGQKEIESERRGMPVSFIRGEQALIRRQASVEKAGLAAQAGAIGAQLEATRGNLSQAQSFASQVVNAATYQYQQTKSDLEWGYNTYSDLYNSMQDDQKAIWDDIYAENLNEMNVRKDEAQQIMNLVLDAASQGIQLTYNPATDDYNTVAQRYSASLVNRPQQQQQVVGFTGTQKLKLEQAGLGNAPRQQQLDFLFNDEADELGYTPDQKKKLRAFKVDINDTELADTLIYRGEQEYRRLVQQREAGLSPSFISQVGQAAKAIPSATKDVFSSIWDSVKGFAGF